MNGMQANRLRKGTEPCRATRITAAITVVVFIVVAAIDARAGTEIGELYGLISCGFSSDECWTKANFYNDSPSVTTDYYGNATVEIRWSLYGSGYWANEDDFYSEFWAWVDGSSGAADSTGVVHCIDAGDGCYDTGTLSFTLSSANGTEYPTVKIKVQAWGEGNNCSKVAEETVSVIRPFCPTSLQIDPIYNQSQHDTQVTISGEVNDDGCGADFSDENSVWVRVEDPQHVLILNTIVDLEDGVFSTPCNLRNAQDPRNYGTYIVRADYTAGSPSGHYREDELATDTEYFDRKYTISIPSPPNAATCYDDYDTYRVAFADVEDWNIYIFGFGQSTPSNFVNLNNLLNGPPLGTAFTPPEGPRTTDPLLVVSQDGSNQLIFLTLEGQEVRDYAAPSQDPFGLVFDGEALWVADSSSGDLFRCEPATGEVLRELHPGLGGIAGIDWDFHVDPWGKATLLAMVPDPLQGDRVYRIDPDDGTVLEEIALDESVHHAVTTVNGIVYVADFVTREFYPLYEGPPSAPDHLHAHSGPDTPETIRLTWNDPDSEPPWSRIRIYRNGDFLDDVAAEVEEYLDEGLVEHDYHDYFLTAARPEDGTESIPSDTVGTYAGSRPPMTHHVPDDYPSIQEGIFAAMDGDSVLVQPGVYEAPIRFNGREIAVLSANGPEETIVDGAGFPLSLVLCDSTEGPATLFSGFTVRGGDLRHGTGVVQCGSNASPTIAHNVITANELRYRGGGIVCRGGGSGAPVIENNTIAWNTIHPDPLMQFQGGGITCLNASPIIRANIIAANDSCGYGIYCEDGSPILSCNDIWDSFLANYLGCAPGEGDFSEDPLFCNPGLGDLRLCEDSPCLSRDGCGLIGALEQGCASCGSTLDWADHDAGNCVLTVTDQGILGFMDGSQSEGSGFVYPAGGESQLYVGGLWVGESADYVASRDFDADPDKEWIVSESPNGHAWIDESSGHADQVILSRYRDDGAAQPRGLFVRQESWAFAAPEVADDLIIIQYRIRNDGSSALQDLYAGVFLDIDIGEAYYENTGSTDAGQGLVYLTDPSGIHVGLCRLEAPGTPPAANLTFIHHETFIWPNEYVLDTDKYAFLSASDPDHIWSDAPDPDDYSVLASSGPFALQPEENVELAFAVVGGSDLDELLANAHVAQLAFQPGITDAPDPIEILPVCTQTRLHAGVPNPMRAFATIAFDLHAPAQVRVAVFDVSGRRIRSLVQAPHPAGRHAVSWDARDARGRRVGAGVYFVRLATDEGAWSGRLVVVE